MNGLSWYFVGTYLVTVLSLAGTAFIIWRSGKPVVLSGHDLVGLFLLFLASPVTFVFTVFYTVSLAFRHATNGTGTVVIPGRKPKDG